MACERGRRGEVAEALAEAYLAREGYRTLARRFRVPAGEIDLIAYDRDVLAFVEVRSARSEAFGHPLASVTPRKQARVVRAARAFLAELPTPWPPMRFDALGVCFAGVDDTSEVTFTLVRGAFDTSPRSASWT